MAGPVSAPVARRPVEFNPRVVLLGYASICGAYLAHQRIHREEAIKNLEALPEDVKQKFSYQRRLKSQKEMAAELEGYKWTAKFVSFYDKWKGRK